jgi:hypothetical protein
MNLLDKIRRLADEPADRDLLEYFGVAPDAFKLGAGTLTVAGESVSLTDARDAVFGPIPQSQPQRTVAIKDL